VRDLVPPGLCGFLFGDENFLPACALAMAQSPLPKLAPGPGFNPQYLTKGKGTIFLVLCGISNFGSNYGYIEYYGMRLQILFKNYREYSNILFDLIEAQG
jgi:hypothetical protein